MKNVGLKIIIIVLCILILVLIGYIIYDKVINIESSMEETTNNESNNQNNVENNNTSTNQNKGEHIELEDTIKTELTEIFKFTYNYYDWGNGYCGSYAYDDTIDADTESNANFYTASSQYKSFSEMINHLKEYMTEHVIYGKHYMSSDSYIEKDGKLYCPNYGKGGNIYQLEEVTIKYSKPYDTVIYTVIETKLVTEYDEYSMYEIYDVTFSKKGSKWIISSYKNIDIKY